MGNNFGAKVLCLLTGVGIGALAGVLFAPHSGRTTRALIGNQVEDSRDYLLRKGRNLRQRASDYVDYGTEALADQRDHIAAAVAAGKQAYQAETPSKSKV